MIAWVEVALAAEIAGRVTGPDGPVAGATVLAYDLRLRSVSTLSDGDGTYTIEVDPGIWRVRVLPPSTAPLVETWAPDADDVCAATPYLVEGTVAVDVALGPGGSLSGELRAAGGAALAGVSVSIAPIADTLAHEPRTAVTDADGTFSVVGLHPEGRFTVSLAGPEIPTQYLPGTYLETEATTFAPGLGTDAVGLVTPLAGISVTGTVLADGAPLAAGTAQVYVPSQLRSELVSDGGYAAVGLPVGDLLVWTIAAGYATTYWPDADRPGERIPVLSEGETAVADLAMPVEARLEGRLPGDGPFDGAAVVAYNTDRSVGVGAIVADDGSFAIGGLHGGLYTLAVYAEEAGLVSGVVADASGDLVFDVPGGAVLDAGAIAVASAGGLTGVVADRYTGAPINGAFVHAESRETGAVATAITGADGAYALLGVAPGEYELWADYGPACTEDPDWLPRWYPDNPTDSFAISQALSADGTITWDPTLPPDFDHDGMDDVWEADHGLDPSRDDSAEDPDGDGFTNLEEYFLGTDPNEAASDAAGCGCATGGSGAWLGGLALFPLRRRRACPAG